ncbi:MAG: hypothetical protein E5X53_07000 [Mesorhizobium sp.]|uniref:hypothetical protein n=1 Tax=Mesorhizobium sp. TaxID=1871066 RepID=UPI000FE52F3D|nr:hypothetical protein [Mesorhizobium sp.]RWM15710.1 MAG: hypothetical protein EOR73_23480 [Mesorhizobium sp.]TIP72622.1 MAG: hypothetical protein E5X55_16950 [Mesorhizobium sp.]TIQ13440.1 MAG: hypothetical protein E5X57_09050 [Mesorhizobium sp.]TIR53315.1 MAG: hypothetical protein E5X53_07000 [Mesorhizobium sp.]TJV99270.1 MAG: hypothetical protein E5X52_05395 [Mesorhizobium sp.]
MKTCLIDAAHPAQKIGSESRVLDVSDIGAKGGFSKVCKHFRMEEEHAWPARASDPKVEPVWELSGGNKSRPAC